MNIRNFKYLYPVLLALVSIGVGLAAITSQSLWMDEGSGAFKALMPTLKDWWAITLRIGGSDVQMPFYMFLIWVWHHLGATSEYALRAVNLPWLVLAVLALRRVPFWPLVCLVSPFVWYYTGELRPYTMQIAAGCVAASALGGVIGSSKGEFEGLNALCAAAFLLCMSSLTGAVWAAGLASALCILRPDWLLSRGFYLRVSPWLAGGLALGGYYAFTLLQGYRATGIPGNGILSVLFGGYEMVGLMGLGPGRSELRGGVGALIPHLWLLIPGFICIFVTWLMGLRLWLSSVPTRAVVAAACAVLLPIVVLTVVGLMADFRVLGRHLSPATPAVLLPIAAAFSGPIRFHPVRVAVAALAVMFMLVSSLTLRFSDKHARDDYRTASAIGIHALREGKAVWWQADMNATRYYAYREGGMPLVNAIQILESDPPASLLSADIVVINRPDLRFRGVDYQKELSRNYFDLKKAFTGFEVWIAD